MLGPNIEPISSNLHCFFKKHVQIFKAAPASTIKKIDKQISLVEF